MVINCLHKSASYALNRKFWLAACVAAGQRIRWHKNTPQRKGIDDEKRLWIDLQGITGELVAVRHANQFAGEGNVAHGIARFSGATPVDIHIDNTPVEVKCVFMAPHKKLLFIDERSLETMTNNGIRKLVAVLTTAGSSSAAISRAIDVEQIQKFDQKDMGDGRRPYVIEIEKLCSLYMYKSFPRIAMDCCKNVIGELQLIKAMKEQIESDAIADMADDRITARSVVDRLAEFSTLSV